MKILILTLMSSRLLQILFRKRKVNRLLMRPVHRQKFAIRLMTDISLLSEAREKSEEMH